MTFARPELLLLLPAALLALRRPEPLDLPGAPFAWAESGPWIGNGVRWAVPVPRWATALGIAGLIATAAGPTRLEPRPVPPEEAVAVQLVLDVSGSMTADGPGGSPLDRTRTSVIDLVGRTAGMRVGLVTFAGSAITRLPPTSDTALLRTALATAEVGIRDDGSAIGTALGLAVERLRVTPASTRAIVLVSDGRHNAGPIAPGTAVELAREAGIPVHVLLPDRESLEAAEGLRGLVGGSGGRVAIAGTGVAGISEALSSLVPPLPSTGPPVRRAATGLLLWPSLLLLGIGSVVRATRAGGVG